MKQIANKRTALTIKKGANVYNLTKEKWEEFPESVDIQKKNIDDHIKHVRVSAFGCRYSVPTNQHDFLIWKTKEVLVDFKKKGSS